MRRNEWLEDFVVFDPHEKIHHEIAISNIKCYYSENKSKTEQLYQ